MTTESTRPARFVKDHGTGFESWRRTMNFTHAQCAAVLGKSMFAIQCYARGKHYNGRPCKPTKTTALLMAAIAQGYAAERPWPA